MSELLEATRTLMKESGKSIRQIAKSTGLPDYNVANILYQVKAEAIDRIELILDDLGYEIVIRRKK